MLNENVNAIVVVLGFLPLRTRKAYVHKGRHVCLCIFSNTLMCDPTKGPYAALTGATSVFPILKYPQRLAFCDMYAGAQCEITNSHYAIP